MSSPRHVEVFSAGCPVCHDAVRLVREVACEDCTVEVLDMSDSDTAERATELGVRALPAVAVDGSLAACCTEGGVSEDALRAEGIGQPLA